MFLGEEDIMTIAPGDSAFDSEQPGTVCVGPGLLNVKLKQKDTCHALIFPMGEHSGHLTPATVYA